MQNNLHLKYILFNVQQQIDTEWHELILFTLVLLDHEYSFG